MPSLEQIFRFNANRGEYGSGDVEAHVRERMWLAALREPHVFERTRPNGAVLQIRGVPLPGGGFLTTYFDITKEKHRQAASDPHNPNTDPVTGLPNWTLFLDRFEQVLALVRRGKIAALHFFDLDRFKQVEAQLGRKVTDGLLIGVALRLRNAARATDTVSRYGDDEFVVLQTEIDRPGSVARLSTRIVDALRQPFDIHGCKFNIGASVGLVLIPRDGINPEELLTIARSNMQRSRQEAEGLAGVQDEAGPVFTV